MLPRQMSEDGFELMSKEEIAQNQKDKIDEYENNFHRTKSPIQLYLAGNAEFKELSAAIIEARIITLTAKENLIRLTQFIEESRNKHLWRSDIFKDSLLLGFNYFNRYRKDDIRFESAPTVLTEENATPLLIRIFSGPGGNDLISYKFALAKEIVMRKIESTDPSQEFTYLRSRYTFKAENDEQAAKLVNLVAKVLNKLKLKQVPAPR